ncbi:hypothetical protein H4R33_006711 [Dimargaris cristalligena]|nr:hypothetical protein H4R33_006711 [Dimargaris cristalligena]
MASLRRTLSELTLLDRVFWSCDNTQDLANAVQRLIRSPHPAPVQLFEAALDACDRLAVPKEPATPPNSNLVDSDRLQPQTSVVGLAEEVFVRAQTVHPAALRNLWLALLNVYMATGDYQQAIHLLATIHRQDQQVDLVTAAKLVRTACTDHRYEVIPAVVQEVDRLLQHQRSSGYLARWTVAILGVYMASQPLAVLLRSYSPELFEPLIVSVGLLHLAITRLVAYLATSQSDGPTAASSTTSHIKYTRASQQPYAYFRQRPLLLKAFDWLSPSLDDSHQQTLVALYLVALRQTLKSGHLHHASGHLQQLVALRHEFSRAELDSLLMQIAERADSTSFWTMIRAAKDIPLTEPHDPQVWDQMANILAQRQLYPLIHELELWLQDECYIAKTPARVRHLIHHYQRTQQGEAIADLWREVHSQPHLMSAETLAVFLDVNIQLGRLTNAHDLFGRYLARISDLQATQICVFMLERFRGMLKSANSGRSPAHPVYRVACQWFAYEPHLAPESPTLRWIFYSIQLDMAYRVRDFQRILTIFRRLEPRLAQLQSLSMEGYPPPILKWAV